MGVGKFYRKIKADKTVVAICYDFDKTLSPDDMQAQGYIQSVGYDVKEFWKESNKLAEENDMDQNLAYMFTMVEKAKGKVWVTRDNLMEYGAKVALFPGVEQWFERINNYAEEKGVVVEHYIISSGLKEMIEGTVMAKKGLFEKIYASSFYYDSDGVAKWPAQAINYTNKTQFLFRIEKGVLDINDQGVNDYFEPDQIRIPFRNMIYIGDSDTDIPCMKLLNSSGGYSIGVYNPETKDKKKVYKMIKDNRIKLYAPADYNYGSELDSLVKSVIDKIASNEKIEESYYQYKREAIDADIFDKEESEREKLIIALENSSSFANTHTIISQMRKLKGWTNNQKEELYKIAIKNQQVHWILKDSDVHDFYLGLYIDGDMMSETAKKVKKCLSDNDE